MPDEPILTVQLVEGEATAEGVAGQRATDRIGGSKGLGGMVDDLRDAVQKERDKIRAQQEKDERLTLRSFGTAIEQVTQLVQRFSVSLGQSLRVLGRLARLREIQLREIGQEGLAGASGVIARFAKGLGTTAGTLIKVAALATTVVVATLAMKSFSEMTKRLTQDLQNFGAVLGRAVQESRFRRDRARFRAAARAGPELAGLTLARSRIEIAVLGIKAELTKLVGPALLSILRIIGRFLEMVLAFIEKIVNFIAFFRDSWAEFNRRLGILGRLVINPLASLVKLVNEMFGRFLDRNERDDAFEREMTAFFNLGIDDLEPVQAGAAPP